MKIILKEKCEASLLFYVITAHKYSVNLMNTLLITDKQIKHLIL